MQAYIKILRLPSLLLLALAMYGTRYFVVGAWLNQANLFFYSIETAHPIRFAMDNFHFALLVVSSLLIAAAGYIINDYFDLKSDRINRPNSNAVGKGVKRRMAMLLHIVLNSIAFIIALYLSYKCHTWKLLGIQIFTITALWLYSTYLKKKAGYGDLVISFITALTPVSVYLYEYYFGFNVLAQELNTILDANDLPATARLNVLPKVVLGFGLLGFISNMVRQFFKDIEHVEGDRQYGNRTLPLVWGVNNTRYLGLALSLLMFVLIALTQWVMVEWNLKYTLWYATALVQIPLAATIIVALRAKDKKQYSLLNRLAFFVMITGVLAMPVLYFDIVK